jgi:hypothetical protein
MKKTKAHPLYKILKELEAAKIHYKLERYREDTVMICVTIVGGRLEIEVFEDGHIETAIFKGDESIESGMKIVKSIIKANRD